MFQRILVAVDCESPLAQSVLTEAEAIALAHHAELHLANVLSPLRSGYPDPAYMTLDGAVSAMSLPNYELYVNTWEEVRQNAQNNLQSWAEATRSHGLSTTATQLMGDPGKALCALAQDWSADLIVLGRRGMPGLGELFLGSVSSYVMHHAPCAVLVVQGPQVGAATTQVPTSLP